MSDAVVRKTDQGWEISCEHVRALFEPSTAELRITDRRSNVTWQTTDAFGSDVKLKGGATLSVRDAGKVECRKFGGTGIPAWKKRGQSPFACRPEGCCAQKGTVPFSSRNVWPTRLAGVEAVWSGWKGTKGVSVSLKLAVDRANSDLVAEVFTKSAQVEELYLPRALTVARDASSYVIIPEGEGAIIPGNWQGEFIVPLGWASPKLPWFGACEKGSGLMVFVETDEDYYLPIRHPRGGPPAVAVRWISSMGAIRYPRRLRFRTFEKASYVTMAKEYRKLAIEQGLLVTLAARAGTNPQIARLADTGLMVSAGICTHDVRRMFRKVTTFHETGEIAAKFAGRFPSGRASGRAKPGRLWVHLDGWGVRGYDNLHPDVIPPCPEAGGADAMRELSDGLRKAGHFLCLHDNYRDIYVDAPSFSEDLLQKDASGNHERIQMWAGGLNSLLCAEPALRLLRRNYAEGTRRQWERYPGITKLIAPSGVYIDNYCMSYECYDRSHPLTRGQSRLGVRALYDFLHSEGILTSCEHVTYWAFPVIDVCYTLTHLKTEWLGPDHEPVGDYVGIPVPLWGLTFHDAVVQHTHSGELTGIGSERWADAVLFGYLGGHLPNITTAGATEDVLEKMTPDLRAMIALHKEVVFDEMVDHRIMSPDGREQVSRFASGAEVHIDRAKREVTVSPRGSARRVTGSKALGKFHRRLPEKDGISC